MPQLDLDPGALACGAALLLTSPWTPMLFMGEEWGARTPWQFFTDHTNPDIAAATAAGRKAEFGSHGWSEDAVPDPQDPATFERSRLDWSEPEREPHARLLTWYRELLALRRDRPDLRDPRLDRVSVTWQDRRLRSVRGSCTVLVNLAGDAWTVRRRRGRRTPAGVGGRARRGRAGRRAGVLGGRARSAMTVMSS